MTSDSVRIMTSERGGLLRPLPPVANDERQRHGVS